MYTVAQVKELRDNRARLVVEAQKIELKTAEDRSRFDRMMDDADGLLGDINRMEKAMRIDSEMRTTGAPPRAALPGAAGADDPELAKKAVERHRRAWVNYMKYGARPKMTQHGTQILGISAEDRQILFDGGLRTASLDGSDVDMIERELRSLGSAERRDMGSGGQGAYPGATTGFFVPVGFVYAIEEALKYYGPMLFGGPNMPDIFDTATGQPLPYPTDNDTTITGELIGEGQQVTSQDVSLGQIILGAFKYSSKLVKVSIELLQDSAFDMEAFLIRKFAVRLGRILNNHFTVGVGTTQPKGIVTAATVGTAAVGSSGNDGTSAGTNTIGSDDLINLEHSVDPLYRGGALYMMHDQTLRQIKTIKDKYGRPLWLPGLAVQAPDTINGYGYRINNDMDQLQASASSPPVVKNTVLFGQVSKYLIRRVKDMSVLRLEERFADFGQIAFLAFARYDGTLLDAGTHPVKLLTNSF